MNYSEASVLLHIIGLMELSSLCIVDLTEVQTSDGGELPRLLGGLPMLMDRANEGEETRHSGSIWT